MITPHPLLRALSRAVTLALFAMIVLPLLAAPGDLDPSWGEDGVVTVDFDTDGIFDGVPAFITSTSDGKVVVSGFHGYNDDSFLGYSFGFGATRYQPNGQHDSTFGLNGGNVVSPFDGFHAYATSGALQSDGKLVMVGIMSNSNGPDDPTATYLTFVRLNADGSLDTTFGEDGFAIHNPPLADDNTQVSIFMSDMVVDAQDRVLLSVRLDRDAQINLARYMLRLNVDGSLDTTFGDNGFIAFTGDFYVSNIQVQPEGKLLVTGVTEDAPSSLCRDITLKRLHPNGEPDLSFGDSGEIYLSIKDQESSNALLHTWIHSTVLLPNGKILLIGSAIFCNTSLASVNQGQDMVTEADDDVPEHDPEFFAWLNPDGTLDTTLGDNGIQFFPFRGYDRNVSIIKSAIQADGKIVLTSLVFYSSGSYPERIDLMRYHANGKPDTAWPLHSVIFENIAPGRNITSPRVDAAGRILFPAERTIERFQGDPAFGYAALTPAHRAGGHPIGAPLTLTFAAPVTAGAGAVEIRRTADSSLFARVDVTDTAQVSGGGSSVIQIDPASDFEPNTAYFALVDPGAFVNAAGHPFSGVRALTEWHFVTGDAPVVVPPTQLLLNRGFEGKGAKPSRPAKWTGTRLLASEGRICNVERRDKPPLIYAQAGRCAFRFKHTASRGRSIAQNITPTGVLAGQVLRLSAQVRRNGLTAGAMLRAQITYTDGTTEALVVPIPTGRGGYAPVEATLTLAKDLASVKVRAVTGTSKGAWLLDAVSLTVEPATGDAGAGNPAGGDGLRGLDLPAAAW
jgi:uncharacterized delta-60 repeat protein